MNIARLQNGNPFRHDCSPPGRKSCIYIKQPNSSKSRISAICARSCFLSCNTLICAIKTWKNISASFIFAGGDPLVLFEGTDKIAQIIKAIPIGNLCDGIIGGSQLAAGLLDSLAVEVIHWCLMRHLGKEPAEIFGRHGNRSGKLLQGNGAGIVLFNKFHDLLQLDNALVISSGFPQAFQVVMITKNQSEKVVKLSKHNQLISGFLCQKESKREFTALWISGCFSVKW